MKRTLGIILMAVGLALLLAAVGLMIYNRHEEIDAQKSVESYLPAIADAINCKDDQSSSESVSADGFSGEDGETSDVTYPDEMLTVAIDGHEFIGFLSLPSLEL